MSDIARKLIDIEGRQSSSGSVPTAIFGTAGTLSRNLDTRRRVRIGMWPFIYADNPAMALGIATVLAFLLERRQDIRVYRLFARVEGDPASHQWSFADSQFDVDDWQLEQLDENAAMWGQIEQDGETWKLTINAENDLTNTEFEHAYTANSLADLVNQLPVIAGDLAGDFESAQTIVASYSETDASDDSLRRLLADVAEWQVRLLLALWGVPWPEEAVRQLAHQMIESGRATSRSFGAWTVTNAIAHAMQPGYEPVAEVAASLVPDVIETFKDTSFPAIFIGGALYAMGSTQQAYDLLEEETERNPENTAVWMALIDIYRRGGRGLEALDAYQEAIEVGAANVAIYRSYAMLLGLLEAEERVIDEYVLIDPADYNDNPLTWEAIAAYEAALEIEPDNVEVLQLLCNQLIDAGAEAELWPIFERLIQADDSGEFVRTVIDSMFNIEDIEPALALLQQAAQAHPNRADLLVNLGVACLLDEREDEAADALERARELSEADDIRADIDRLMLSVDDPEFEEHLGEITAMVDSDIRLSGADIDFLEEALENAPMFPELYVLLGKAYAIREDHDAALETLLDGNAAMPEDPDIIEQLGRILWESGEQQLAFDYLNKGIEANPYHVPLLTLTGRYLFETGQRDHARAYLARAEAIAPRHPAVTAARSAIAQILSDERD